MSIMLLADTGTNDQNRMPTNEFVSLFNFIYHRIRLFTIDVMVLHGFELTISTLDNKQKATTLKIIRVKKKKIKAARKIYRGLKIFKFFY